MWRVAPETFREPRCQTSDLAPVDANQRERSEQACGKMIAPKHDAVASFHHQRLPRHALVVVGSRRPPTRDVAAPYELRRPELLEHVLHVVYRHHRTQSLDEQGSREGFGGSTPGASGGGGAHSGR